jgi:hypothetical protein
MFFHDPNAVRIASAEVRGLGYLLLGAILLIASIGGLWFSRPVDGQMRAFARQGRDVWIAIAVTTGVGIGISALIAGLSAIQG